MPIVVLDYKFLYMYTCVCVCVCVCVYVCACVFVCVYVGPFKCYVTQRGGCEGVSAFTEKRITKVYGSTLLALRGGGWVSNIHEKSVM